MGARGPPAQPAVGGCGACPRKQLARTIRASKKLTAKRRRGKCLLLPPWQPSWLSGGDTPA
eukprot:11910202-Prorocentrum_lima.AAC.1